MIENRSIKSRIQMSLVYGIVLLFGLACFFPLINIVAISLSSSTAVNANKVGFLPVGTTFIAYRKIVEDNQFWRSFGISVVRVLLALSLNMILTVPMAYALTKNKKEFMGRNIYINLLIFAMLFNGGMIPTYILVKKLGLLNTIWSLVLPGALPIFDIILLMNFFLGIPKSLEEAAIIDGANPIQILFEIMIPCAKPVMATVALFSIVGSWNDFFSGLVYIQKIKNLPIMTYIQSLNVDIQEMLNSGATGSILEKVTELSNRNLNAAKIVVAVVPLLIIYPYLQKYLITGIVMGSVKE